MSQLTTRERILDSALSLFSERGYDGVGVDLIAEKAGLKGPSLYKHFKGKEEILDTIIDKVEIYYETNFGSEGNPGSIPSSMEDLNRITLDRIKFTLRDETVRRTRRVLAMEQFRSERIAKLATKHNLDGVQRMYCTIFRDMMNAGVFKKGNPEILAMQFVAPISLLIQVIDREPEREQEAMKLVLAHLEYFAKEYGL